MPKRVRVGVCHAKDILRCLGARYSGEQLCSFLARLLRELLNAPEERPGRLAALGKRRANLFAQEFFSARGEVGMFQFAELPDPLFERRGEVFWISNAEEEGSPVRNSPRGLCGFVKCCLLYTSDAADDIALV